MAEEDADAGVDLTDEDGRGLGDISTGTGLDSGRGERDLPIIFDAFAGHFVFDASAVASRDRSLISDTCFDIASPLFQFIGLGRGSSATADAAAAAADDDDEAALDVVRAITGFDGGGGL